MTTEAFEREKTAFEHNAAQMRALNAQMNTVPTISVTLTGGLWFAASQAPALDVSIKFGLLIFAGIANLGLVLACLRIRDVSQSYLEKIKEFSPAHFASGKPEKPVLEKFSHYSMISVYASLMCSAAALSFIGAFFYYWPSAPEYHWIGLVAFLILLGAIAALLLRKKTM